MISTGWKILNISIIIPTLNEEKTIGHLLSFLQKYQGIEFIVADGGSDDLTRIIARYYGAKVVVTSPGRGGQMNKGAESATGDILLFLHSDTLPPADFHEQITALLATQNTAAGAFRLHINASGTGYRFIEWGTNVRSSIFQMPYGDQALFISRDLFCKAGGFADQMILEDVELIRRLKKLGKIRLASGAVTTSPRRWQKLGLVKTILLNQYILAAYFSGVTPGKLAQRYYKDTDG